MIGVIGFSSCSLRDLFRGNDAGHAGCLLLDYIWKSWSLMGLKVHEGSGQYCDDNQQTYSGEPLSIGCEINFIVAVGKHMIINSLHTRSVCADGDKERRCVFRGL